jgi:predicted ATPase
MVSMREVVGREAELAAVLDLLDAATGGCRALLIEGEPGIGKSTFWSAALAAAADRGFTVLSCRCAQPEVGLSFSGLADLTEPVLGRWRPPVLSSRSSGSCSTRSPTPRPLLPCAR